MPSRSFSKIARNKSCGSERTIDQMSKGSGSAEPYSPPSMVVLFSDDHSLPSKGYSSSVRHDRLTFNVTCSSMQTSE